MNKIIDEGTRKGSYLRHKANKKLLNSENELILEKNKIYEPENNKSEHSDYKPTSPSEIKELGGNILKNNDFLVVNLNNERHFVKKNLIPLSKHSKFIKQIERQNANKPILNRSHSGKISLRDLTDKDEEEMFKSKKKREISIQKKGSSIYYEIKPKFIPNNSNFSIVKALLPKSEKSKATSRTIKYEADYLKNGDLRSKILNSEKMKILDKAIKYELDQINSYNWEIEELINAADKKWLRKVMNPFGWGAGFGVGLKNKNVKEIYTSIKDNTGVGESDKSKFKFK